MPLYSDIEVAIKIVDTSQTSFCHRGQEYCIMLYSEKKDNYLQNIGYLGEQLDLYLVSHNIGSLWFGIGRTSEKKYKDLDFVIMIAIHKVSDQTKYRRDMFSIKRKSLEEIWEGSLVEGVSNIVRFTPSACNTQPWFVKSDNNTLSIYRLEKPGKRGIMPYNLVPFYNRIDIGIFLCFMELCLTHEGYTFEKELHSDDGNHNEYNLNAIYRINK